MKSRGFPWSIGHSARRAARSQVQTRPEAFERRAGTDHYAQQPVERTLAELGVTTRQGLTADRVRERQQRFGRNEIEAREEPLWHRVFRRFWGPIPWMIEIAAVLSAVVRKWEDLAIILVMLGVNAALDFFQERRALNALSALGRRLATEVLTLRGGRFENVASAELVPGDIVKLRSGNIVPADLQLLQGEYLLVDQSTLTGESLPVSKKPGDVAYANTIVKQGEMLSVVVNTGVNTNFHSVVELVSKASLEATSHFQKMVIRIGDFLIASTVGLVLVILMVSLFRHENMLEIARFALVLTVAAIPVALPAVMSVTLAVGALELARRQAIVSRLTAIEELAGVDIFCSDKTGTLTRNQMQVAEPIVFPGFSEQDLCLMAILSSQIENQDPIETPLFDYVDTKFPSLDWESYRRVRFVPFDPVRKRTEAEIERGEERFLAIKGAPQVLIEMAGLPDDRVRPIQETLDQLATRGYRTLAVGRRQGEQPLEVLGLIPLYDPPRDDSSQVIADMRAHGIQVKMVTGDNLAIGREIGRLLGLGSRALRAKQLSGKSGGQLLEFAHALSAALYQRLQPQVSKRDAARFADEVVAEARELYDPSPLEREFVHTHESALLEQIEAADVFAEMVPEDKYRIVDTLQKSGHLVAMTGDGVNDAPALRKADCGIAVPGATDAARAAADIILVAPGLGVINEAIKQARITFERMQSYALFRVAETIRIILFMTLSIVIFSFYPITALMIILLALLNDIPILAIAYDRTPVDPNPVRWNTGDMLTLSTVLGVAGVVSSFLLFFVLKEAGFDAEVIQSLLFLKLIVAGHSTVYVTRSRGWFWQKPYPAPLLLGATFTTELVGTLIAVYGLVISPIGWRYALYVWAYALTWFVFNDVVKQRTQRVLARRRAARGDD